MQHMLSIARALDKVTPSRGKRRVTLVAGYGATFETEVRVLRLKEPIKKTVNMASSESAKDMGDNTRLTQVKDVRIASPQEG